MATKRGELVPRPPKKIEYEIRYATADAAKGWQDLAATIRNSLAEAWDFLTRSPLTMTPTNYPLRGELGTISRGGKTHERWQHKPTLMGTARIWFFVEGRTVYLEQVHTSHPNETKEDCLRWCPARGVQAADRGALNVRRRGVNPGRNDD